MTDRSAAEVMCCPSGCVKDRFSHKTCCAGGIAHAVENLHAAGYMIVPREATKEMAVAAMARSDDGDDGDGLFYGGIYRAMTGAGELK